MDVNQFREFKNRYDPLIGKKLSKYTVQLFEFISEYKVKPHASGILVSCNNRKFMISAGHVFSGESINDICIWSINKEFCSLGGNLIFTDTGKSKENKVVDIAIIELDEETKKNLGEYEYFSFQNLNPDHEIINKLYYCFGFPASRSKSYSKGNDHIKIDITNWFFNSVMDASNILYKKGDWNKNQHILISFDKKNMTVNGKNKQSAPKQNGMSGSGIWQLNLSKGIDYPDVILSGIYIEINEAEKVIVGIRVPILTETLRLKFDIDFPKSKLVKLNL